MRTFDVVIGGTKPILLHNPAGMGGSEPGKKKIPTFEEEARAGCYWTPDGESLAIPCESVHSALIMAAAAYKQGRTRAQPYVAGSLEVVPEMLSFCTKEYKIDTRRVVLNGKIGVLRSRPKLFPWKLSFALEIDEDFPFSDAKGTILPILQEAGRRLGIGDFRPQKKGKFGKFVVVSFEERVS